MSIELKASNVTNGFDLGHNLDLWIFKVKCDLDLWPHAWPSPRILMVKFWNSCISEWEGWFTLNNGDGSKSFMTMTVIIWWPKSGLRIYQIVTGVTSVVGVPSTHLVSDVFRCKSVVMGMVMGDVQTLFKGLITVGRELRQQHPSDLLSGAGTSRERSSRDVPAGQQITRVLLP